MSYLPLSNVFNIVVSLPRMDTETSGLTLVKKYFIIFCEQFDVKFVDNKCCHLLIIGLRSWKGLANCSLSRDVTSRTRSYRWVGTSDFTIYYTS